MILHPLQFDDLLAAIPHAAAVVERGGRVIRVNEAWRSTWSRLVGDPDVLGLGVNYLEACDEVRGVDAVTARAAAGFRSVVAGEVAGWVEDHSWHGPDGERRHRLTITPVGTERESVLVGLADVTDDDPRRHAHRASHDDLTGLPNRMLVEELYRHAVTVAARHDFGVAVAVCDVRRFARVNEELGPRLGDDLLRAVGARLVAGLRPSDIVGRLAGDDFVVLLPDVESIEAANAVAARLEAEVSRPFRLQGTHVEVRVDIGVVLADPFAELERCLRRAAAQLPVRRQERTALGPAPAGATAGEPEPTIDLTQLTEEGLLAHFQPIVDVTDGSVVGAEALLRWRHPHYGVLAASEFLGLALNDAHQATIAEQALVCSAETWAEVRDRIGGPAPQLFLNLSPRQLRSRRSVERLHHLLVAVGLPADEVVVELTEQALDVDGDDEELATVLGALRDLGVRIALDDFGCGHSSLGRLRRLPIEVVKLDRSMVQGVESDRRARQLLASVASMAGELELDCVVEGCETAAEAEVVAELGFRFVQGYHFGRPTDAASFAARLVAADGPRAVAGVA